ncbi:MAG: hypothetical protein OEZ06_04845 [Myxococcales bacterium]|nr:hypothetical protein [Myxococcales bacterium]
MKRVLLLLLLLPLAGCASEPAPERPAAEASSGEASPAAATEAEDDDETAAHGQERSVDSYMAEHFAVATFARDAVINGQLEALREPLLRLAEFEYRTVVPGGWMEPVAEMQQAARLSAEAKSLDLAATGVASMARVCGQCHRDQGRGPHFATAHRDRGGAERDTLGVRMYRHMWAADRLWEGLTGPSDESWQAGAEVLAGAPRRAPESDAPLPQEFVAALGELRDLGERARGASSLEERGDIYGLLLASCAGCHDYEVKLGF